METRKIIEVLRGTIDINQRQQAEEELNKVRKMKPRFSLTIPRVSLCPCILIVYALEHDFFLYDHFILVLSIREHFPQCHLC